MANRAPLHALGRGQSPARRTIDSDALRYAFHVLPTERFRNTRIAETPFMETRPYFIFGDLLANALAGMLVGIAMAALFGPSWNMWIAMFLGMAVGMALSMPIAVVMGAFFGAMEVMVPVMTTGMVSGMVVSMAAAMAPEAAHIGYGRAAELGLYSGLGTLAFCYVANALIRGRASRWTA